MKYRTIVADPAWTPSMSEINGGAPKASPQAHYETMTVDAICALRPPADEQAHLYVWCLAQHADWGFDVARAWGFEPLTMLTWCKPGLGAGRFRCNTEHIVVARKGSRHGNPFGGGGRSSQATDGTWFDWPRGAHSAKPDAFYDLVEQISPGPYLEMFSRRARLGWDTWGDEALHGTELFA